MPVPHLGVVVRESVHADPADVACGCQAAAGRASRRELAPGCSMTVVGAVQ
jgi:hypothetical protein